MRSMVSRTRSRITLSMVAAPTSRPSSRSGFLLSLPTASSSDTRSPAGAVVAQLRRMMTPSFHFSTTRPTLPSATQESFSCKQAAEGAIEFLEPVRAPQRDLCGGVTSPTRARRGLRGGFGMDGWRARWALGLLVFSAALFITLLLAPLKESGPFTLFTLFIGATAFGSWYGGPAAGLTVASLSVLAGSYFILAPVDAVAAWGGLVPLAAFVGVALLI